MAWSLSAEMTLHHFVAFSTRIPLWILIPICHVSSYTTTEKRNLVGTEDHLLVHEEHVNSYLSQTLSKNGGVNFKSRSSADPHLALSLQRRSSLKPTRDKRPMKKGITFFVPWCRRGFCVCRVERIASREWKSPSKGLCWSLKSCS